MTQESKRLTREQKEAVGILSIGTFLEFFDFMLYIHMAVLLNDLFFPKSDPHASSLLAAFAFCSSFVLRPVGALIFGWIGDNIGRKATVVITTFMMALSCFVMANIPTYAEIGITAAIIVTICRIVQGLSSMGEIVGAELYLTELVKPPLRNVVVGFIIISGELGGVAALGIASLVTSFGLKWRLAFWFGLIIALVGGIARRSMREAPDYTYAKLKVKRSLESIDQDTTNLHDDAIFHKKVNKKTILSYFFMEAIVPVSFYLTYIYCSNILKYSFDFTSEQIIHHNLTISLVGMLDVIILTLLCYRLHPLKIIKFKLYAFAPFAILMPFLLEMATHTYHIFIIQYLSIFLFCAAFPANSVIFSHFPILKRFSSISLTYSVSRAILTVVTSFGVNYLTDYFGAKGLLILILPLTLGYIFARNHFESLERAAGTYY